MTRLLRLLPLVVGISTWATTAGAAPSCGSAHRPWVSVAFASESWPRGFDERVLGDLRAGLQNRGIDTCSEGEGPGTAPLASVRIAPTTRSNVAVTVEIRDAVTEKRVMRDVDLTRVPADGRAFAIAIAVDELVWASWAEIALTKRGEQKPKPAPPEVVHGVERVLPRREEPGVRLGARGAFEHYAGGETELGVDLTALFPLTGPLGLDLSLGLRTGRGVDAPHGRVQSSAAGFGAMLRVLVLRAKPLELSLFGGPRAAVVRFTGHAAEGAQATELSGLVLFLRGGALASVRLLGPLSLELGGGAGAPLRGLEASDAGEAVSGVSGLELFATAGLMVEL